MSSPATAERLEHKPPASAAAALAATTSVITAHTAYGQVVDDLRRMEPELDRIFERLQEARVELRERAGVEVTPLLSRPMNAAYAAWHSRQVAGDDAGAYRVTPEEATEDGDWPLRTT